jgi:hypothetical protein
MREGEALFEVSGGASTTGGTSPNGFYRLGVPRLPNCQAPPCTTYYRVDDPAYMVDSGQTMGEWTILAPLVSFRAPRLLDLDVPPRRGWEATNVGVPPVPRICFPDCWTEWSTTASWLFSVGVGVSLVLYLALGVVVGRSRRASADEDKPSMIQWHPHYATIGEGLSLVHDGVRYVFGSRFGCGGQAAAGKDDRETYDDLPPAIRPPKRDEKDEKKEKKKKRKKEKKEKAKQTSKKEKRRSKPKPGQSEAKEALSVPEPASRGQTLALVEKRLADEENRLHSSQQKIKVAVQTLTL